MLIVPVVVGWRRKRPRVNQTITRRISCSFWHAEVYYVGVLFTLVSMIDIVWETNKIFSIFYMILTIVERILSWLSYDSFQFESSVTLLKFDSFLIFICYILIVYCWIKFVVLIFVELVTVFQNVIFFF